MSAETRATTDVVRSVTGMHADDHAQVVADELAERTRDMAPAAREAARIENATSTLFDMWLRFEAVFAARAIDRLEISDADAEAAATRMEDHGPAAAAFAHLLRRIPHERRLRELSHKAIAVWAAAGTSEPLAITEIHERYAQLPKGTA